MLRLEVQVVHGAGEVLGSFEFTLHKRLVDDHLGGDVGEFAPLPCLHLLSHGLKASLHSVDTNRNAVNERERLRVFREHRGKHAGDNVTKSSDASISVRRFPTSRLPSTLGNHFCGGSSVALEIA